MTHDLSPFLAGAIFFGYLVIALLFIRFWSKTGDRLFAWFFVAFLVLALERAALFWDMRADELPLVYTTRLVAFVLIIIGVVDRNRTRRP